LGEGHCRKRRKDVGKKKNEWELFQKVETSEINKRVPQLRRRRSCVEHEALTQENPKMRGRRSGEKQTSTATEGEEKSVYTNSEGGGVAVRTKRWCTSFWHRANARQVEGIAAGGAEMQGRSSGEKQTSKADEKQLKRNESVLA
jgi:hypothetical protein